MNEEKEYYDKLAEKYLTRVLCKRYMPDRAVNLLYNKVNSEKIQQKDYLYIHPWEFHLSVTSECNLRCKHCYFAGDNSNYTGKDDLTKKELFNLADELSELNVCHIKVSGGEPFLRSDIFDILTKLKSKNFSLAIQTNATLIDSSVANKLSEILVPNIDTVQVSVDGAKKETHELTRGINSFDRTINGIKNLVKNGIYVQTSSVMTSVNIKEFPQMYTMLHDIGIKSFAVSRFLVCNEAQKDLVPDFKLKLKVLNELVDIESDELPIEFFTTKVYEFVNEGIGLDFLKSKAKAHNSECMNDNIICHHHDRLFMNGKGNVYLCYSTAKDEYCLGNVKNSSMETIWQNRLKNIFFAPKPSDNSPCKDCEYFSLCKTGCPMKAYKKYNTVNAPDSECLYGEQLMQKISKKYSKKIYF